MALLRGEPVIGMSAIMHFSPERVFHNLVYLLATFIHSFIPLQTRFSRLWVADERNDVIDTEYERWRELKRMVIVFGLPREEPEFTTSKAAKNNARRLDKQHADGAPTEEGSAEPESWSPTEHESGELVDGAHTDDEEQMETGDADEADEAQNEKEEECSLRGRIWKVFLGVNMDIDSAKYTELAGRGASSYDGDIRNDTFRCVAARRPLLCCAEQT